jgi:hypothetical protein
MTTRSTFYFGDSAAIRRRLAAGDFDGLAHDAGVAVVDFSGDSATPGLVLADFGRLITNPAFDEATARGGFNAMVERRILGQADDAPSAPTALLLSPVAARHFGDVADARIAAVGAAWNRRRRRERTKCLDTRWRGWKAGVLAGGVAGGAGIGLFGPTAAVGAVAAGLAVASGAAVEWFRWRARAALVRGMETVDWGPKLCDLRREMAETLRRKRRVVYYQALGGRSAADEDALGGDGLQSSPLP